MTYSIDQINHENTAGVAWDLIIGLKEMKVRRYRLWPPPNFEQSLELLGLYCLLYQVMFFVVQKCDVDLTRLVVVVVVVVIDDVVGLVTVDNEERVLPD